ncbi:hypothetical protein [Sulfurimonas paralvinellae]|uniref:Guanylate cyclase domain-containing protein n=1 Tax=Sulfurimonas paralvinellae TaxID=317658 RepID=A0A7M1B945_9BACT|nr:hypothetical protein [Sulfurimonas paralvinellae]QOP46243.1 hypothetical protein FM071_08035 [Sulfurimonas paralvinellae]
MPLYREITTDIVLIDIIDFSKLDAKQQLEIISFLTRSYRKVIEKMLSHSEIVLESFIMGFIPTGDGFYCILSPKYKGYGVILGLSFNHFSDQIAKMFPYFHGIRIAVHTGGVNQFRDILGHKNFIGDGLNDCARYLELKDFTISTVMVSDTAYENFKSFLSKREDYKELLQRREFKRSDAYIFQDKHHITKRGYLVWMRKSGIITPPKYKL